MVGDEITFTVPGVKGNQVRLGIAAPKQIAVHRVEIYERIKREQRTAVHGGEPVPSFASPGRAGRERQWMTHGYAAVERLPAARWADLLCASGTRA